MHMHNDRPTATFYKIFRRNKKRLFILYALVFSLAVFSGGCRKPDKKLPFFFIPPPANLDRNVPPELDTLAIGIPEPNWGTLHPVNTPAPAHPAGWPDAEVVDFYYIDNTHPQATDQDNPYGYPQRPRLTVPIKTYTPGSYIEMHGGPYPDIHVLRFPCTEAAPCWLRGAAADQMPRISGSFRLFNPRYLFMEYLDFNGGDGGAVSISGIDAHHVSFRKSFIQNRRYVNHTSALSFTPDLGGLIHNIVVTNNTFRELGNWQSLADEDFHGVVPSLWGRDATTELRDVWIMGNLFYHISGNGVQVNAGNWTDSFRYLHHVYLGKNIAYENRQAGFWSKQSSDVIISQNISYAHRLYGGGVGDGIGYQYGPNNLWIIFNEIYDCNYGIRQSATDVAFIANRAFIIGNLIYNIHPEPGMTYDPTHPARPGQGISLWQGSMQRYVLDNTIYDVRGGINSVLDGPLIMSGNIISGIHPEDYHITSFHPARNGNATIDRALFHDPEGSIRFRWDWLSYEGLAAFQTATGQCANCLTGDPLFTNASQNDFSINTNSPAHDANVEDNAYAIFFSLYGIDIRVDHAGNSRPRGAAFDLGAREAME